jgi:hypothetical protein
MVSKKFNFLLTGLLLVLSIGTFAQSKSGYDVNDSSVITPKRMPQQNEFKNNSYDFPAKPRNQWELGVSAGNFNVFGDVSSKTPSFGFAVNVRKSLGYVVSLRAQYMNGTAVGMNWQASENFSRNGAWNKYASIQRNALGVVENRYGYEGALAPKRDKVYYNYKNKTQDLSVQGIFSLNNIRFHTQSTGYVFYVGAGIGASAYQVKVNALDASGNTYADKFASLQSGTFKSRKDVLKSLKAILDDTYETDAENHGVSVKKMGDNTLKMSTSVIAGFEYKLSKRINIALEDKYTFIKDDLLDGQQWQENTPGLPVQTANWDSYNYLSLGLNFNIGSKSVEPLWWLNPLDYAYSELNNPRHMKLPKPVLDDADGDGVTDQLDREPSTPAGCPVNTHGVSLDTDGDGVPDCKDKQLITPTECQPVDADGVGKCPEPECCKKIVIVDPIVCPADYPSVSFKGDAVAIDTDTKALLSTVASKLKANPTCSITANGYPDATKASQAVCQKRLENVKKYLVEIAGISADRISTNCEVGGGDKSIVDLKSN